MRKNHIVNDTVSLISPRPIRPYVLALFFLLSCQGGDSTQQEHLYGRWEIARAERNGKETNYLRRGYFIIDQNGSMTVNLTGADEKGPYKLSSNKLVMGDKNFDLQMVKADSMVVRYMTGPNSQFVFYMHKKHEDTR